MSSAAKPSVQISGTRGQGLGSHLCGRISVTRCPIPDYYTTIRRLEPAEHGARANAPNTVYWCLDSARGVPSGRGMVRLETRKLQGKTAEDSSPDSRVGMEKVELCDNEGAAWGRRGWD